jgi:hypothetical protein
MKITQSTEKPSQLSLYNHQNLKKFYNINLHLSFNKRQIVERASNSET